MAFQKLSDLWLQDQSIAFAAGLLGHYESFGFNARDVACAELIVERADTIRDGLAADSTISLVATINAAFLHETQLMNDGWPELASLAAPLADVVDAASREINRRNSGMKSGLNRLIILHAVYILKKPHLPLMKFLTWLHRAAATSAVPGLPALLTNIKKLEGAAADEIETALAASRDSQSQTRDRLEEIDTLHTKLLETAGNDRHVVYPWLSRILTAYRSSLYCWPLLNYSHCKVPQDAVIALSDNDREQEQEIGRGISLPTSLFLYDDKNSSWKKERNNYGQKIWFKYKLTKTEEKLGIEEPKFREIRGGVPAHISGYCFAFDKEWWDAFGIGVDVAKKLWLSQNGRLRFADDDVADVKLRSSLYVDLRAACEIVNTVYSKISEEAFSRSSEGERFFTVWGRSAEAYWVQCVLGLLLPAQEPPLGICTGRIEYLDGEFEMQDVDGIEAKLLYANRAGVPRVVIPGDCREFTGDDEKPDVRLRVKRVIDEIRAEKSGKAVEVNLARTARAAADAMQSSGWRRANFFRTPEFQRAFGHHQRRLFLHDALADPVMRRRLKKKEIDWYNSGRRWFEVETQQLERLDAVFLSGLDRSVKYIKRSDLHGKVPGASVEEIAAKWLAWKDNQVRSGDLGYRGPGLGVLAMRTAAEDNEIRLWAAIAELLDADAGWWERFQWSNLQQSAQMLAGLLCNQKADRSISTGSAPDLLFVFDDERLTQRRTNSIFPTDYNHQFFDLLNPRHRTNHKRDYLDDALKEYGVGKLDHPTRVFVVYEEPETVPTSHEPESHAFHNSDRRKLNEVEQLYLERLSIFRFGCSRQAAYAMVNFERPVDERATWLEFEEIINRLIDAKLLVSSRGTLYIPKDAMGMFENSDDGERAYVHLRAARALCPILSPNTGQTAGNKDRQLEPENVLEAAWHLQRAFDLDEPYRYRASRIQSNDELTIGESQAILTFLRVAPDWDTVKKLRVNPLMRDESIDLGRELIEKEREQTGADPHTSRIGLHIETLGRHFKNRYSVPPKPRKVDELAADVCSLVNHAITMVPPRKLDPADWKRRLGHLYSRQIFALRMLGIPFTDVRMANARIYVESIIGEILRADFIPGLGEDFEGLSDYPLSQDFWRCMWLDGRDQNAPNKTLSLKERSTYAFAAARANLIRRRAGRTVQEAWDEPWIVYFGLTQPYDIAPAQLAGPLKTWRQVCGSSPQDALAFGRRVLDLQPHARRSRKGAWEEQWSQDVLLACSNLWSYVTHAEPDMRLVGPPVAATLDFIRATAVQETIPTFLFLKTCGSEWLAHWATLATSARKDWPWFMRDVGDAEAFAWQELAREVTGCVAGWVAMLSDLESQRDHMYRMLRVGRWLQARRRTGSQVLKHSDPEDLLRNASGLDGIEELRISFLRAQRTGMAISAMEIDGRPALPASDRNDLTEVVGQTRY